MKKDEYFMNRALELALKARGKTSPNPMVGALVVRNGKILASGYHHKAGSPHAEIIALRKAGNKSKNSKLFVTLEPCSHFGRTPPCVDSIVRNKIKQVIIGIKDPNPVNNGKSIRILRKHGIKVKVGYLEDKLKNINEDFNKYITRKIPFVVVKVAQSLDGKIALSSGDSKWITSKKTRDFSRNLRKNFDAILVGINTILKDDPLLNCPDKNKRFFKIIVDSDLKVPLKARIFSRLSRGKIIIATCKNNFKVNKIKLLSQKGAIIIETSRRNEKVDLKFLLRELAGLEIISVLVEGGSQIVGSFFDECLVDKVLFFIAPKIIGGENSLTSVAGEGINTIKSLINLKDVQIKSIGEDLLVEAYVYRNNRKPR
ncbi:MAG: bifunctional diaminohydroxyphosphoribosylaminopyrimidine deaminase/5-amino-6-(5-phosphoribosylamino)uracil reductase RibD [Candidatus Omnitrophica bacterium]|nr:bifunctional diaminohydroxyphosphoribosylaminopyrimidine deaminase/5-amino-6-(5-phosphoribosylamino)uracil reductase RibD [Candidatus Omnitrophota bacterium]